VQPAFFVGERFERGNLRVEQRQLAPVCRKSQRA
jgi:hypothetical protein